jgi:RNA polymerase sigma-70 factor (ECF subfamily)
MADKLETLVEDAAGGDREAVASLLQTYVPGLRAYLRLRMGKVLRQKESCSDLVQSVCREVLENLEQFRYPGEAAFKRWLYATAARKLGHRYEHWQAERRDPRREAGQAPGAAGDGELLACYRSFCTPSRAAIAREELERIEKAFDQLSSDHRDVIIMARILGLSRAEIAKELHRSEPAVGNLLLRALAHLSEVLDGDAQ